MFRGVYSATSGMIASQRRQEMLTNNLANANTPGFKADQTVLRAFPDLLIQRIREEQGMNVKGMPSLPGHTQLGSLHSGVYAQEGIPLFTQGDIQHTGRNIDLAIVDQGLVNPDTGGRGHLFFAVDGPEGEIRYTRNGQFAVNAEGFLTTSDGYYVLNQAQDRIEINNPEFKILEDGRIIEDPEDDLSYMNADRVWLGYTEQPERLIKEGNGLLNWIGEAENQPQDVAQVAFFNDPDNPDIYPFQIMQGYIEHSNVDSTQTMTEMMSMFRLYEANQKVLQAYDRSMEKLVNEVGRVF